MWMMLFPGSFNFNSRPHGGRHKSRRVYALYYAFQLTPSRRATENALFDTASIHISTHALTEGDEVTLPVFQVIGISTHALTEGDLAVNIFLPFTRKFQLTPSRRATHIHCVQYITLSISTHALTEGDHP